MSRLRFILFSLFADTNAAGSSDSWAKIRCLVFCEALLLAHGYIPYYRDRCTAGQNSFSVYDGEDEDDIPQSPDLCLSYIIKYEMHNFYANHSAWVEEYFDYRRKMAKISVSCLGMEFVDVYDYGSGTVTSYQLARPEKSGWSSKIEATCKTVEMADFEPSFPVLSYPISKTRRGPQIMPTANRALKYGPPYNYSFVKYSADVNSTRGVRSEVYEGCINEGYLEYILRSDFYWGQKLPFSYPSGDKRSPLFVEMRGPSRYNGSQEAHVMKYVAWFEKDPEFTTETFQIPIGLHCEYLSERARLPHLSSSFSYAVEETKFVLDKSGFLEGGFQSTSYREVWYDYDLKLARIDMRPTKEDFEALGLQPAEETFEVISLLFDLNSGITYLSYIPYDECRVLQENLTYFWKHENGTLKSPEELIGISSNLQYKGRAIVMGIEAEIWTELIVSPDNSTITKREVAFSARRKIKDPYRNKYAFPLLQDSSYMEENRQEHVVREFVVQNVTVKNYYGFKQFAHDHHVFGQHACIPEEPTGSYYVYFRTVNTCPWTSINKVKFLTTFHNNLADAVGLTTTLSLQNFKFRWIRGQNISVGFTFHEGIHGEKLNEREFATAAEESIENSAEPLNVTFRLTATSDTAECWLEAYLFHKEDIKPQPPSTSELKKCHD